MSGRWMLAAALLVLAGGFWFYSRLIKKDAKGAENPFPARERWTGLGQLAASCLGLPLMISPFAAMQWGWAPALAAAVGGGILFGAAQNLAVSGCLTAQEGENRESAAEGRSISGWKRRAAAAPGLAAGCAGRGRCRAYGGRQFPGICGDGIRGTAAQFRGCRRGRLLCDSLRGGPPVWELCAGTGM